MRRRNPAAALLLLGTLALPASSALAAGQGNGHHGRPSLCDVRGNHAEAHGQSLRQFEGMVLSLSSSPVVSGTTFVLQPQGHHAMTVTLTIVSSTVITAGKEMSNTTLAAGQRVHVAAKSGLDCGLTAARISIKAGKGADDSAGDQGHKNDATDKPDHGLRQLEGSVLSLSSSPVVSGTTLVLQTNGAHGMTTTVGINSSTVITADEGVTMTTLAVGEQVHVATQVNPDGSLTAVRVEIQKAEQEDGQSAELRHKHTH